MKYKVGDKVLVRAEVVGNADGDCEGDVDVCISRKSFPNRTLYVGGDRIFSKQPDTDANIGDEVEGDHNSGILHSAEVGNVGRNRGTLYMIGEFFNGRCIKVLSKKKENMITIEGIGEVSESTIREALREKFGK